jgi:peptidoglycan/LPS O-acetylase OafA/YrhL
VHARSQRFPLFDSLRAIAAVSVLMLHAGGFAPVPDVLRPYVGRLDVAVAVFFLISGFLLYRPFE